MTDHKPLSKRALHAIKEMGFTPDQKREIAESMAKDWRWRVIDGCGRKTLAEVLAYTLHRNSVELETGSSEWNRAIFAAINSTSHEPSRTAIANLYK